MKYPKKNSAGEQFEDVYSKLGGLKKEITNITIDSELPTQTGHNGEYLKTNGTNASWQGVVISITYETLYVLGQNGSIKPGQLYLITDSSKADTGILVTGRPDGFGVLEEANAGFLNADFQGVGDYSATIPAFNTFRGIWTASNEGGYNSNGDITIYNNQNFVTDSHTSHDGTPPQHGVNGYYLLAKSLTKGYIEEWDKIIYDLQTDTILWRMDKRNNKINNASLATWDWGNDDSHSYRQESGDACYCHALNNRGRVQGIQSGNHNYAYFNNNSAYLFIDSLSDDTSIQGDDNSGNINIHVRNSTVSFNNNSGTISGRFADRANWNFDNNTEDWLDMDATNGTANLNPSDYLLFGGKGGDKSKYLQNGNYQTWTDLKTADNLPKGKFIFIYNDEDFQTPTDLGIRIFCETKNKFALRASGGFLNPDYQGVGDYGKVQAVTGIFPDINVGVWQASNEGVTIYTGIITIWNGYHYQCINDGAFDGTAPDINTTAYQVLPKSAPNVGYIEEWDDIEYDFDNNWIQSREDRRGNKVSDTSSNNLNAIANFQWGNNSIFGNKIIESSFYCLNAIVANKTIANNIVSNQADINATFNSVEFIGNNISAISVDMSGISQNYTSKTLSPHLSTFDIIIDITGVGTGYTVPLPDYIGRVTLLAEDLGNEVSGFSTNPSFPLFVNLQDGSISIAFTNASNLVFPTPSIGTVLTGNEMDFIEFQFSPGNSNFYQIASEQY